MTKLPRLSVLMIRLSGCGLMRLLPLAGIVLLAACSDSNDPDGGEPADIEGSWTWTADLSSTEIELTCTTTGGATIEQSDDRFTGQILDSEGTCSGPEVNIPFDLDGAFGSGVIEGSAVSFQDDRCEYTGVATGDPVDEIEGDVTCTFAFNNNGETVTFDGSWEMTR